MATATSKAPTERSPTIAAFSAYVRLVSVDPARNRFRYYQLTWQQMLFGGGALVRCWGRIGTRGRALETHHSDRASAQPLIEQTIRLRTRHGYQLVDVQ